MIEIYQTPNFFSKSSSCKLSCEKSISLVPAYLTIFLKASILLNLDLSSFSISFSAFNLFLY